MLDCRYHGMCKLLSYDGNCTYVCPETGRCQICELMPDVKSLRALADELDTCTVDRLNHLGEADRISGREYAERIRGALGVADE